jgi:hypothetical protein
MPASFSLTWGKKQQVANEGHRGGTLKFQGEAPQLSDGGHFFQLNGETSMDLLTPSVHNGFTVGCLDLADRCDVSCVIIKFF